MSERKSRPPQRGVWYAKTETNTNRQQPSIQKLLELVGNIYIFFREEDRNLFTFAGMGTAAEVFDETPVKIIWRFHGGEGTRLPTQLPEEIDEYEAATVSEAARLVDWSIGRLVDWSIGRLVDWSIGRFCLVLPLELTRVYRGQAANAS